MFMAEVSMGNIGDGKKKGKNSGWGVQDSSGKTEGDKTLFISLLLP